MAGVIKLLADFLDFRLRLVPCIAWKYGSDKPRSLDFDLGSGKISNGFIGVVSFYFCSSLALTN